MCLWVIERRSAGIWRDFKEHKIGCSCAPALTPPHWASGQMAVECWDTGGFKSLVVIVKRELPSYPLYLCRTENHVEKFLFKQLHKNVGGEAAGLCPQTQPQTHRFNYFSAFQPVSSKRTSLLQILFFFLPWDTWNVQSEIMISSKRMEPTWQWFGAAVLPALPRRFQGINLATKSDEKCNVIITSIIDLGQDRPITER